MTRASYKDRHYIVDILTQSFHDNQRVNYITRQDSHRHLRIRRLMEYSFDVCHRFGEVYLSDDGNGCVLVLLPDKKTVNLKSILLDLKLIFTCIGLRNVRKVMNRETKIKKRHPHVPMYYLWYIGVLSGEQHKGTGSNLLRRVMDEAARQNRPVYLETSTLRNIPWYEKWGFTTYYELDLGYKLYFMRNE